MHCSFVCIKLDHCLPAFTDSWRVLVLKCLCMLCVCTLRRGRGSVLVGRQRNARASPGMLGTGLPSCRPEAAEADPGSGDTVRTNQRAVLNRCISCAPVVCVYVSVFTSLWCASQGMHCTLIVCMVINYEIGPHTGLCFLLKGNEQV